MKKCIFLLCGLLLTATPVLAANSSSLGLVNTIEGYLAVAVFILAYIVVIFEDKLHINKSIPLIISATLIWFIVSFMLVHHQVNYNIKEIATEGVEEFTEIFLFLVVAMTYINTLTEIGVFQYVKEKIISLKMGLKSVFWFTGLFAFFVSPFADNMTTALITSSIVLAVAPHNKKFIVISFVNIVVAANAGGAFSPFGDITTLMVWQSGLLGFFSFFKLFLPSVVNWFVPALIMSFAIKGKIEDSDIKAGVKRDSEFAMDAIVVILLFMVTIFVAAYMQNAWTVPAFMGMVFGLALLQLYALFRNKMVNKKYNRESSSGALSVHIQRKNQQQDLNFYKYLKMVEWDTLFFFYGVILSVSGLGIIGYLIFMSNFTYNLINPTYANILVGLFSAIFDNIPIVYAVLNMHISMSSSQWLLVTLTAGVGGSILSIGSAAGVAIMGKARGTYTFFAHLKWSWVVLLGFILSVGTHILLNG